MNHRLRPDHLDPFINVARLICRSDPPSWLPEELWRWNRWLYRDRFVEETRPSRAQMRRTLLEVEEALFVVTEALESPWVREFLDVSSHGPIFDPERLTRSLEDLQDRATQARAGLATKAGATRPGPGKAETGGDVSPHLVRHHDLGGVEARPWGSTQSEKPPPAEAAEAYWGTAGGEPRSSGEEPLAFWRHHFKKAAASRAKDFRTEWRRHLDEAERRWTRRKSVSDAA